MHITQRQVALGLQIVLLVGLALITVSQMAFGTPLAELAVNLASSIGAGVLFYLYWRGWRYAPHALMIASTVISTLVPPPPLFGVDTMLSLLIPPVTALILGGPAWIVGTALVSFAIGVARSGAADLPPLPPFYILYVIIVGGMVLARLVTDTALESANASALHAEEALHDSERQSGALAAANRHMEEQIAQQGRLLDLVATLEAPATPLAEGVVFVPIVGAVDARRADALTTRILHEASARRARLVILDIAGVAAIDVAVARGLLDTVQALRLLGCDVALSGISAQVALTLVDLEVDLRGVATVRSPQEALARYITEAGDGVTGLKRD
jgi:anti-anti-sigma regulatory factor